MRHFKTLVDFKSSLLIALIAHIVLLPLATVNSYFWSGKFATLRNSSRQESSMQRQRLIASTTTTPAPAPTISSMITTTQLPPIELQFEINTDDSDQQQQQQQQPLNGTLILEDLVHQMERHFSQKKRGATGFGEISGASLSQQATSKLLSGQQQQQQQQQHQQHLTVSNVSLRRATTTSPTISGNNNNKSEELSESAAQQPQLAVPNVRLAELLVEPVNYTQSSSMAPVTSVATDKQDQAAAAAATGDELASSYKPSLNDTLVDIQADQDDDRLIQYDTGATHEQQQQQQSKEAAGQSSSLQNQLNGRLMDVKSTSESPPGANLKTEFTLEPINIQSEQITVNSSSSNSNGGSKNSTTLEQDGGDDEHDEHDDGGSEHFYSNNTLLVAMPVQVSHPGQQQQQQQHQARSMSSGTTSRLPQHSKPPYDSYNQFQHRSELQSGANLIITTNNHRTAAPATNLHHQQQQQQQQANTISGSSSSSSSPTSATSTSAVHERQQAKLNETSMGQQSGASTRDSLEAKSQVGADLVSSLKRISSHLMMTEEAPKLDQTSASQSSATATTTTTTTTTTTLSSSTTTTTASPVSSVFGASQYYEHVKDLIQQQQQQQDELKRVEAKLGPINELVDLSPIPATGANSNSIWANSNGNSNDSPPPALQMAASDDFAPGHYFYSGPHLSLGDDTFGAKNHELEPQIQQQPQQQQQQQQADAVVSARYQNDRYTNSDHLDGLTYAEDKQRPISLGEPANKLTTMLASGGFGGGGDVAELSKYSTIRSSQSTEESSLGRPPRHKVNSSSSVGSGDRNSLNQQRPLASSMGDLRTNDANDGNDDHGDDDANYGNSDGVGGALAEANTLIGSHQSGSASSLSLPQFGPQLHKKTLESLSNQIQHSDLNLLQQVAKTQLQSPMTTSSTTTTTATSGAHQHKERSPNLLELFGGGGQQHRMSQITNSIQSDATGGGANGRRTSYAASLINVTAPMVLPLSATEAMEASLGNDQAARQLMHQVGGHSVLGGSGSQLTSASSAATSGAVMMADQAAQESFTVPASSTGSSQRAPQPPPPSPNRSTSFYVVPAGLDQYHQHRQPSIYSQPANRFSPRPVLQSQHQHHLQHTNSYPSDVSLALATSGTGVLDTAVPPTQTAATTTTTTTAITPTQSAADRLRHRGDAASAPTPSQQASGFRSPPNMSQHLYQQHQAQMATSDTNWPPPPPPPSTGIPTPSSYLSTSGRHQSGSSTLAPLAAVGLQANTNSTGSSSSSMSSGSGSGSSQLNGQLNLTSNQHQHQHQSTSASGAQSNTGKNATTSSAMTQFNSTTGGGGSASPVTTNGFITGSVLNATASSISAELQQTAGGSSGGSSLSGSGGIAVSLSSQVTTGQHQQQLQTLTTAVGAGSNQSGALNKRVSNLTRVEHISAECSNDLIRTIIIFNGTFKGIIYSSGYVRDPQCLYINGTGKSRYDFSIRLNQCGTLGRQEVHPSSGPNDIKRRDQVMWNTLSIQYNPIIEQEWDEHFRVSCEYGSDFWKTISFSPFNVETNTGSPVVFTVDPPQCQMEILKGHGMIGPRQEAISGPVTVGDPLTLLIHMKSEKAGYDILVKNCIAHNGGQQKMQLIDSNGCVVNERFISPFRGTYNDNDLKHVTLYSYLKAFRFTGSPVLYLECEVHMCQSACPPQMCYWRRLSKRSTKTINSTNASIVNGQEEFDDDDLDGDNYYDANQFDIGATINNSDQSIRFNLTASTTTTTTEPSAINSGKRASGRVGRKMQDTDHSGASASGSGEQRKAPSQVNLSDRVSLFQALEVRQERETPSDSGPVAYSSMYDDEGDHDTGGSQLGSQVSTAAASAGRNGRDLATMFMCYRRAEVFAFMFTVGSVLLAAISVTIGCCLRASSLKRQTAATTATATAAAAAAARNQRLIAAAAANSSKQLVEGPKSPSSMSHSNANSLGYSLLLSSYLSPSPSSSSSSSSSSSGSSSRTSCSSSAVSPFSLVSSSSPAAQLSPEATSGHHLHTISELNLQARQLDTCRPSRLLVGNQSQVVSSKPQISAKTSACQAASSSLGALLNNEHHHHHHEMSGNRSRNSKQVTTNHHHHHHQIGHSRH